MFDVHLVDVFLNSTSTTTPCNSLVLLLLPYHQLHLARLAICIALASHDLQQSDEGLDFGAFSSSNYLNMKMFFVQSTPHTMVLALTMTNFPHELKPIPLYHDQIDYVLQDGSISFYKMRGKITNKVPLKLSLYKDWSTSTVTLDLEGANDDVHLPDVPLSSLPLVLYLIYD